MLISQRIYWPLANGWPHCQRCRLENPVRLKTIELDLAALKLPVLVTHGAADRIALPAAAKYTAAKITSAKLSLYDGIGHAPFWEDTARFNAELAAFVRTAYKTN
jgi:pimeloyl-ACP methyl ester carboxylesterase